MMTQLIDGLILEYRRHNMDLITMKLPAPLFEALRSEALEYSVQVEDKQAELDKWVDEQGLRDFVDPRAIDRGFYRGVYIQKIPFEGLDVITGLANMSMVALGKNHKWNKPIE